MKSGSILALCIVGLTGCITTGKARDEEYAVFKSRSMGYLRVSLDRDQYESNDAQQTATQKGSLESEERDQVAALTTPELMDHYVETSDDRESCLADENAFVLSTRTSLGGCWTSDQVNDADTQAMLDYMIPLLQKYTPAANDEPAKPKPEPSKDAGKDTSAKDAGSKDAGSKDAGKK